jgi:hypothetical protein
MELSTVQYFNNVKKSDTLVIYGSGYSIYNLTKTEIAKLSEYDSIGFNWFCKSHIPTTYYVIREQCLFPPIERGEGRQDLIREINKNYSGSFLIVVNMRGSGIVWKKLKGWKSATRTFRRNKGIVVKERFFEHIYKSKKDESEFSKVEMLVDEMNNKDVFKDGLIYYACTMSNIIHLALQLKYKNIIFVGVDLYDHRYFWLPKNKLREITRSHGRGIDQKHKTANFMRHWSETIVQMRPDIHIEVRNEKSLIAPYFKTWKLDG